ncbi:BF3164 family lipoprotein [Butyricimonas sp.]|uniref:BF3164 family lipoprotein n=1 Tax=Butyricimonas sp. TaxID=1969738 RepID=UPI0025B81281|nr:BF3164 family lipoprotein [Butyricimonas sp.]
MNKLSFLFMLILFSCVDPSGEKNEKPLKRLKIEGIQNLSEEGIYDAWGILKVGNKFIVRSSSGIATVEAKNIDSMLSRSVGDNDEGVILYDCFQDNVVEYFTEGDKLQTRSVELLEGQKHLVAARGRDFIISTGLYENGRYLYTPREGEARYFLSYPDLPDLPDLTEKMKAILYASSVLRVRPDGMRFVCADMYSGVIDFCCVGNGSIELVNRLCLHMPDIRLIGKKQPKICYTRDSRMGFTDVAVAEDLVYVLYSGKSYREAGKDFTSCDTLMVFDWDGNLQNTYNLEHGVTGISYEVGENVLYAVSNAPHTPLFRLQLPE